MQKQFQRLRRASAAVGLLMLLSLGVLEPLLCIIHCDFLMASMQHAAHARSSATTYLCTFAGHSSADTMTMHDQPAQRMAMSQTPVKAMLAHAAPVHHMAIPGISGTTPLFHSPMADASAPTKYVPQPQPFHEMALVAMLLFFVVYAVRRGCIARPHAPPQRFPRPPLRPPTALTCLFSA